VEKMKKGVIIWTIFVVALLMAMTFVSVSAVPEKSLEQWTQEHTVEVEHTMICKYEQGYLEIKEIYSGKDIEKKFGVDNLTRVLKIPVEAEVIGMKEGEEKVLVTEKTVVLTRANDPFQWWVSYDYPQWTYSRWWDGTQWIYEREDPINLAWENTDINAAKAEILEEGWHDIWWPFEYVHYVYDPEDGWIGSDGVADDWLGIWGRNHTRLWQMSDGDVVANAHHDDPFPHEPDQYEPVEELVAEFYEEPEWTVYEDNYYLNNYVSDPYSNGWATQIYES